MNNGTIDANANGATLTINPGLTNSGTLSATGGGTLAITPTTFTNSGTLTLGGGTLNISATNWTNPGTLNIQVGTVNLGGALPGLGIFNRTPGSIVNLTGTLTNTGNTLDIGSAGLFGPGGLNSLSGTIVGGTLINSDAGHALTSVNGTLDGVTIGTTASNVMNLTGTLLIRNGLTLGNGVTFNIANNTLAFQVAGTQHLATLGTSTLVMAGGTIQAGNGTAQTLQIDASVTVRGFGTLTQSSLSTIINAGTIVANSAFGQAFTISPNVFTNSGTLSVSAGALTIQPATFTNSGTLTLGGGTLNINATNWTNPGTLNIQSGTVNLGGTLPALGTFNRTAGSIVNVTGTLTNTGNTLDIGGNTGIVRPGRIEFPRAAPSWAGRWSAATPAIR